MFKKYFFILIMLSFSGFTKEFNGLEDLIGSTDIISVKSNSEINDSLKNVLKSDYGKFFDNFDVYGDPYNVKGGGVFIEGWLQDLYLYQSSALVIEPDGHIYAAWVLPGNNKIEYRTNDKSMSGIQVDIKKWSSRFENVFFEVDEVKSTEFNKKDEVVSFETNKFIIKLTKMCTVSEVSCNKFNYEGTRKSDHATLRLTGKATRSKCKEDICPIIIYSFKSKGTNYIINNIEDTLTILVKNKIIFEEKGKWIGIN